MTVFDLYYGIDDALRMLRDGVTPASFVDVEPADADNFALRLASELPAIEVVKREPVDVGNGITFERFHLRR